MFFTDLEQQAVTRFANMMIGIDDKAEQKEMLLSYVTLKRFNVTEENIKASNSLDYLDAIQIIANMQPYQKRIFCAFMGAIIVADGNIDKAELTLWNILTALCKLPTMSIQEAIEILKDL